MKKKSPRGIPDFSKKQRRPLNPSAKPEIKPPPPVPAPQGSVKPWSTSSKSGRRGG